MGADGVGNFDNDQAQDLLADIEDSHELRLVGDALNAALAEGRVSTGRGCEALAAAELVAAALGRPPQDYDIDDIVSGFPELVDLRELALAAVQRIATDKTNSELHRVWEPEPLYREWLAVVDDLAARLRE